MEKEQKETKKEKATLQSIWETLSQINVNEHIDKKPTKDGKELSYLSWAWAWGTLKEYYPNSTYDVREWNERPYLYDENLGYLVQTSLTIEGITQSMRLPVMDGSNKAQKSQSYTYGKYNKVVEPASMFDVNTAIMRCLTKNMALFGLGHYIYAGEDLPEAEVQRNKEEDALQLGEACEKIRACESVEQMKEVYESYPQYADNKVFRAAINNRNKELRENEYYN